MEATQSSLDFLDLLICPGFCVKENIVIRVNEAARRSFLEPGMEISPLLITGQEEYASFHGGCLCLRMNIAGRAQGVTVSKVGDVDVFLSDEDTELRELQILSLAAKELRLPLSNVILSADRLNQVQETKENRETAAQLSRGAAQLQRLICNMSDALRYTEGGKLQVHNITALFREIFEKIQMLTDHTGVTLHYEGPEEDIYTLAEPEQLERAIYNLISNSLKFTPAGGSIEARLKKQGKLLFLTIKDSGTGIADGILRNIFTRYLRQPSLEDSRFGPGLGMVLIRAAAANHGGTVLIDRLETGTRITVALAIQKSSQTLVRSPVLTVDYAGERDHGLLELSESLPAELYQAE